MVTKGMGQMYKRFVSSVLAVMMLIGVTIGGATSVAADTDYTCPDNSCSFTVPDYYSKLDSDSTSITFKDADSGGVFAVLVSPNFPGAATLDDVATVLVDQFSQSAGYQAGASGVQTTKLGTTPARSFSFLSNNSSGVQVDTVVFFAVNQGRLYALTFAATPDKADTFVTSAKDVFASFSFM